MTMSDRSVTAGAASSATAEAAPTAAHPPSQQNGIDIHDAMSILASRAKDGGEKELRNGASDDTKKGMGQTIDLFEWTKVSEECGCVQPAGNSGADGGSMQEEPESANGGVESEEKRKAREEERKKREAEIRSRMEAMNVRSLLNAVFEAQSERAAAYREFDRGLDAVLTTGNITKYPAICARATASFSVLSETVNTIRSVLADTHKRRDLAKLLALLQKNEKEKLNTTAALHLERIREKNEALGVDAGGGDERITRLLREGVVSLKGKVAECIASINETLEELRYAEAEEEEEC